MHPYAAQLVAGQVNLESGWSTLWSTVTSAAPGLGKLLDLVGVGLMVFALFRYFYKKRHGGADTNELTWTLVFAAVCAGPDVLFPLLLKICDMVINMAISAWNKVGG